MSPACPSNPEMVAIRMTMIELGASILTQIVRSLIDGSLCKIDHSAHAERACFILGVMLVQARLASVK
jgi:hypothetical protein